MQQKNDGDPIMIKLFRILMCLVILSPSLSTLADDSRSQKTLLYIQPFEYTNSVRLWHFHYNYWFNQGPVVEKIALEKMPQYFGDVSMCESNQTGRLLIWLQPKMFFNPQLQVFYGEISANVYTGLGKLVGSYDGEARIQGHLDIFPEKSIAKSYALAMDKLIENMRADTQLAALPNIDASDTPCNMVTLLPTPKVRAMSF